MAQSNQPHTPGPWKVTLNQEKNIFYIQSEHIAVAEIYPVPHHIKANADLIASAPALRAENARLKEILAKLSTCALTTAKTFSTYIMEHGDDSFGTYMSAAQQLEGDAAEARAALAQGSDTHKRLTTYAMLGRMVSETQEKE